MAPQHDAAYATLVMTDSYLPGAMVLGHSLRNRGAKARLAALVLIEKLSIDTINELQTVYDDIVPVEQFVNMQPANLYLMNRPDLISTFTKIELWKQTQYKRIVYLDADMVVLRAPNELLSMDTNFAAVPDVGWPDCFNSGLLVLNPNMGDYYALSALAKRGISFDGADQGLLNMHFTEWERLSFVYNCTPNANYQYVPAYKHFQSSINIIHFIGAEKPWTLGRDHRTNSGVYGELLARWWAVYDRHYRRPEPVRSDQYVQPRKKVQDFVRGEETRYEPAQPTQNQPVNTQSRERRASSGYQITQPQPQPVPGIHVSSPPADSASMERPFGDQPSLSERIDEQDYKPTPTQEQRRWSAPHAEWEPARQPPPANSKPEAENFPSQQYEMSQSTQFFEAPAHYPEPPKDMWYEVPTTKPTPSAPPKVIFPWEERAPKPTRVFPRSREPSPPPVEEPEPEQTQPDHQTATTTDTPTIAKSSGNPKPRRSSVHEQIAQAFNHPPEQSKPPQPPQHVFPWEKNAPKPTRVFADFSNPRASVDASEGSTSPPGEPEQKIQQRQPDNPWDAFAQQSNKWDEDPEITRFVESFNRPRRVPIQVVHDSRTPGDGPPPAKERRTSLKLTDFPTEVERPSLPVTPAPIRRPNFWGGDEEESQKQSILPVARGVPRQDEWNPLIKLEELQRKQSLLMTADEDPLEKSRTPPQRQMPESKSAEEVIEAAIKAMSLAHEKPKAPAKPILKEPTFEVTRADDDELRNESIVFTAHMTATGSKSPTRFNPIVLEGEAASERNSFSNYETRITDITDEANTADHHSGFSYSTSSLSPTAARTQLKEVSREFPLEDDVLSPTTVA